MCFAPLLFTLIGIVPAAVLKGFWTFLYLVMVLASLACVVIVFKLSSFALTLKDALRADVAIIGAWVFSLSMIEVMLFTMLKGFTPWVLLICLPAVFIPVFFGLNTHKALKKENYNPKEVAKSNTKGMGFFYGILGAHIGAIFRNVDQSTAIIIALFCFGIVNGALSIGFLSIQKLHYIKKFKFNL